MTEKYQRASWIIIAISFGAGLLSLLFPPKGTITAEAFYVSLFIATVISVLYLGVPYLFWSGLKKFKSGLRDAYKIICLGIISLGISQGQQAVMSIFDLWHSLWVRGGFIALPFLASAVLLFLGVRKFARLLDIDNYTTSFWAVLLLSMGLAAGAAFLPHIPVEIPEGEFALSLALVGVNIGFAVATTVVILEIKHKISSQYAHALGWFYLAMFSLIVADVLYLLSLLVFPVGSVYEAYGLGGIPFFIGGLLTLKAGHAFTLIGSHVPIRFMPVFFGAQPPSTNTTTPVDIIIFLASLASDPKDIDEMLDELRGVTSKLASHQASIAVEDQARLAHLYLALENYLTTNERLRIFTKEDIRFQVEAKYPLSSQMYGEFLSRIA
jgi:hypothetical protein